MIFYCHKHSEGFNSLCVPNNIFKFCCFLWKLNSRESSNNVPKLKINSESFYWLQFTRLHVLKELKVLRILATINWYLDPDELLQTGAFHLGLHCLLRLKGTEINLNFMFVCVDAECFPINNFSDKLRHFPVFLG